MPDHTADTVSGTGAKSAKIAGILLLLAGFVITSIGMFASHRTGVPYKWHLTAGKILQSSVITLDTPGGKKYKPVVTYEFELDDTMMTGKLTGLDKTSGADGDGAFPELSGAQAIIKMFPQNVISDVYYNSINPAESNLKIPVTYPFKTVMFIGVFMTIIGLVKLFA